jgi:hypothetical protein
VLRVHEPTGACVRDAIKAAMANAAQIQNRSV